MNHPLTQDPGSNVDMDSSHRLPLSLRGPREAKARLKKAAAEARAARRVMDQGKSWADQLADRHEEAQKKKERELEESTRKTQVCT